MRGEYNQSFRSSERLQFIYNLKLSPPAKGYRFPLCISCTLRIRPSQSKQVPVQSRRRRGGGVVCTFQPPGEPLKQVLVPLSVGRGLFSIGDLSMSSTNRQKNFLPYVQETQNKNNYSPPFFHTFNPSPQKLSMVWGVKLLTVLS